MIGDKYLRPRIRSVGFPSRGSLDFGGLSLAFPWLCL